MWWCHDRHFDRKNGSTVIATVFIRFSRNLENLLWWGHDDQFICFAKRYSYGRNFALIFFKFTDKVQMSLSMRFKPRQMRCRLEFLFVIMNLISHEKKWITVYIINTLVFLLYQVLDHSRPCLCNYHDNTICSIDRASDFFIFMDVLSPYFFPAVASFYCQSFL